MQLAGKVALITGANSGIGLGIAKEFARRGCDIAANARRQDLLETVMGDVAGLGRKVLILPGDVASSRRVAEMVGEALDTFGHVDILVNSAGHHVMKDLEDCSDEDWEQLAAVHLGGAIYFARAVVPAMKRQGGGKIINISSGRGQVGASQQVLYSTVKAGLLGFTKALSKEVAPFRINVNAIAPGYIITPLLRHRSEEDVAARVKQIPWRRAGKPEDVAYLAGFLASEEADFITGQVFPVNGGEDIVGI